VFLRSCQQLGTDRQLGKYYIWKKRHRTEATEVTELPKKLRTSVKIDAI